MNLKIEYLNKQELKPYVNNAKIHTAETGRADQEEHSGVWL